MADADGIDLSAASLSVLRENAAEEGLEPTVWQGDMTQFTVDRAYALAICPFNALQELRSVDDRLAALDATYDALAPGGSFVFDLFVPDFEFICGTYGELLFAEDSRATMLPRDEVELLARASPFEAWHVTGGFSDEPLADGHTKQVWTLEKTG